MSWVILFVSAALEAVWATALSKSQGLTVCLPSAVFLVATVLSMVGLARATKKIPIGTAYAVWTGLGAALTATYAIATGTEEFSWLKVVFLVGIVACAVGLKALSANDVSTAPTPDG